MSFRRRIALLAGLAVAVAILLASTLAYLTVRGQLLNQVDDSLSARAEQFARRGPLGAGPGQPGGRGRGRFRDGPRGFDGPPRRRGGFDFYEQVVAADGSAVSLEADDASLPVDAATRAVAEGSSGPRLTNATVGSQRVRVLTSPLPGGAVQLGRSLAEVDAVLARTRWILLLVACGGVALAALLGRLVAGRAIEPLRRLTATAEHVAQTQDLDRRMDVGGRDEIGRLAQSFDEMLDALQESMTALDASVRSKARLIGDASHELRTPLTSLRTNVEVLQQNPDLDPERRRVLLDRTSAQAEELTSLMNDVIELARGDEPEPGHETIRLDELVDEAIERTERHAPAQAFTAELDDTTVIGSPGRLARAVNNLLDNAVRWNAPGEPIDVRLDRGRLTVRDHGPGFPPEELDQVFDRFFRGAHAREESGSGLGLAIVRQVAESHRGRVEASNAPGGGAELRLELPPVEARPQRASAPAAAGALEVRHGPAQGP